MSTCTLSDDEIALTGQQEAARRSLLAFTRYMFRVRKGFDFIVAPHHLAICRALTEVMLGQCNRLIINVPPRYSKTEIAVVNFMAFCLGHWPDCEFIHTSYSSGLAANNAFATKMIVESSEYQALFPKVHIRTDSKAKGDWRTTEGGVVYSQGSGGTITGFGAGKMRPGFGGGIIIDDPHKADEARSDTMRNNVIEWFQNTLESRKNSPQTPIILIMQRLHEKDLSGWLEEGGNGEDWKVVRFEAIQPDGTALWPFKHTIETLRKMEEASPYVFSGQYQQRPSPREGGTFKPDRIQVIDALPEGQPIRWCRGWDLAGSTSGDHTAGVKLGRLADGRFVIGDVIRVREGPDERDATMKGAASRDGRLCRQSIPQDPGQAGKTQALHMARMLAGYMVHTSPESGDKITRAEVFASQVNVGNVLMMRGSWNDALVEELRMFPNGSFDDQVDALSRANEALMIGVPTIEGATPAGL